MNFATRTFTRGFVTAVVTCAAFMPAHADTARPPMSPAVASLLHASAKMPIPALGRGLAVELDSQENAGWGWAACSQMVMEFLDPRHIVRQGDEAAYSVSASSPSSAFPGGWQVFSRYNWIATEQTTPITWDAIIASIKAGQPVIVARHWAGGGGEMEVVTGWSTTDAGNFVHVCNPWPTKIGDTQVMPYDGLLQGAGYDYWAAFTKFKRSPKPAKVAIAISPLTEPPATILAANRPGRMLRLETDPIVDVSARSAFTDCLPLITDASAKSFGLSGSSEIKSAKLGSPIREFLLPVSRLTDYKQGDDPMLLLTGTSALLYPVVVNRRPVAAMRVWSRGGKAKLESLGNVALINAVAGIVGPARLTSVPSAPVNSAAIRVPGLGLYFVSQEVDGALVIASVVSEPAFGLTAGVFEPAGTVFARLAPFATGPKLCL